MNYVIGIIIALIAYTLLYYGFSYFLPQQYYAVPKSGG